MHKGVVQTVLFARGPLDSAKGRKSDRVIGKESIRGYVYGASNFMYPRCSFSDLQFLVFTENTFGGMSTRGVDTRAFVVHYAYVCLRQMLARRQQIRS